MNNLPCRFHLNIESVLKQEGLRVTKQRLAIWDEIKSSESHREIEAVLISLKKSKISVSRATLYRTIEVFVKYNLVNKISFNDGKVLYEHNKKTISPNHNHIICEICGKVFEFFDDSILAIENEMEKELKIKITNRSYSLSAFCNDSSCSEKINK